MEKINIALNIDHNFVQHCAATINSVMLSYKGGAEIVFYIVHSDLSDADRSDLASLFKDGRFELRFLQIDDKLLAGMPTGEGTISASITLSTYFRLMLAALLPREVGKVIYLDSDVYVNDTIDKLWATDINGYAVAGVPEPRQTEKRRRLGLPDSCYYVNAGVSVMNLDMMRKINYPQKALEYARENKEKILYHDQDIQNAVLHDLTAYIPHRWNMVDVYFYKNLPTMEKRFTDEILACRNNPSIIHFAGYIKPWHKECQNPYRYLYWQALKGTKWENAKMASREKRLFDRVRLRVKQAIFGNPYIDKKL